MFGLIAAVGTRIRKQKKQRLGVVTNGCNNWSLNKNKIMNYLLSVENLKKLGLIHSNTDTKILAVAIKRSQDIQLQPAIVNAIVQGAIIARSK